MKLYEIEQNNVVYCSISHQREEALSTPKGFVPIKASDFWKVIEDENA